MRAWQVGGALIRRDDGLVLVANRRRDRSVDWTPPGGVIDPGETISEGLIREVREETGLVVHELTRCAYRVEVQAPELDWVLTVEAWEADVSGEVCIADPDGIVEHCRAVPFPDVPALLLASPAWIQVPVGQWIESAVTAAQDSASVGTEPITIDFGFRLLGSDRRDTRVERIW
jgi:8-oxo-dGTP diphosphatase